MFSRGRVSRWLAAQAVALAERVCTAALACCISREVAPLSHPKDDRSAAARAAGSERCAATPRAFQTQPRAPSTNAHRISVPLLWSDSAEWPCSLAPHASDRALLAALPRRPPPALASHASGRK